MGVNDLRKFAQYEAIAYRPNFKCVCGKSGDGYNWGLGPNWGNRLPRARLVGWCCTPSGYMMVFECPFCFAKFRYHGTTTERNDETRFLNELKLIAKLYDK